MPEHIKTSKVRTKADYKVSKRELGRIIAAMTLTSLSYDVTQRKGEIVQRIVEDKIYNFDLDKENKITSSADPIYIMELVDGVLDNQEKIDNIIESCIIGNKISLLTLDKVLHSFLQLGCLELMVNKLDKKMILGLYVHIASYFFIGNELRIINGILQGIANIDM